MAGVDLQQQAYQQQMLAFQAQQQAAQQAAYEQAFAASQQQQQQAQQPPPQQVNSFTQPSPPPDQAGGAQQGFTEPPPPPGDAQHADAAGFAAAEADAMLHKLDQATARSGEACDESKKRDDGSKREHSRSRSNEKSQATGKDKDKDRDNDREKGKDKDKESDRSRTRSQKARSRSRGKKRSRSRKDKRSRSRRRSPSRRRRSPSRRRRSSSRRKRSKSRGRDRRSRSRRGGDRRSRGRDDRRDRRSRERERRSRDRPRENYSASGPPARRDSFEPAAAASGWVTPAAAESSEPAPEAVPGRPLDRLAGAQRDNKPAWMTKGLGVGTAMFGETKTGADELLKPGLTRGDLERIEKTGLQGPDPFAEIFAERKTGPAAPGPMAPRAPLPDQGQMFGGGGARPRAPLPPQDDMFGGPGKGMRPPGMVPPMGMPRAPSLMMPPGQGGGLPAPQMNMQQQLAQMQQQQMQQMQQMQQQQLQQMRPPAGMGVGGFGMAPGAASIGQPPAWAGSNPGFQNPQGVAGGCGGGMGASPQQAAAPQGGWDPGMGLSCLGKSKPAEPPAGLGQAGMPMQPQSSASGMPGFAPVQWGQQW